MTGEDFYFYIDKNNDIKLSTLTPIRTVGSPEQFFEQKGVEHYWKVDISDSKTYLTALTEALKAGANPSTIYDIIANVSVDNSSVIRFAEDKGIELDDEGDRPIISLFSHFAPEVETDKSNDEEE